MKILFYILAIALVLCACGSKVLKSNSTNAERTAIFLEKFAFNPDTSFQVGNDKILYLKKFDFEEDTFKLYVFEKTEHDWQLIKDSIFLSGYEYRVDSPEISLINGQSFFYFEGRVGRSLGGSPLLREIFRNVSEPPGAAVWKGLASTQCYAIALPGRKSAFRVRFWPDCYRESTDIGPPAGLRPAGAFPHTHGGAVRRHTQFAVIQHSMHSILWVQGVGGPVSRDAKGRRVWKFGFFCGEEALHNLLFFV